MSNIVKLNNNGALMPQTMGEAMQFAEMISRSDMVPKDYKGKPANVMVAIQWGAEIGLAPLQSLQNIAVINGRPSIYGDSMLALVQGSGLLQAINESIEGSGDNRVAVCRIQRKGNEMQERRFSIVDAKKASLWAKSGPWSQYPERMMQMRARGFALRDLFADVLRGMHIAEEAMDIPAEDVTPPSKPAPQLAASVPEDVEAEDVTDPLATEEQKLMIQDFCKKARFTGKDMVIEMKRDFGQAWETMTEAVAAQMIERLGIRIQELEGSVS